LDVPPGYQPDTSSAGSGGRPREELPRNRRGAATPEALSVVLRNAQHLLSGLGVSSLSHIAGRLEQDGSSSDPTLRSQIQTEAVQVGLAMQHLGALLLELGRTILTLRMAPSPVRFGSFLSCIFLFILDMRLINTLIYRNYPM
jgi:hypothetical protein